MIITIHPQAPISTHFPALALPWDVLWHPPDLPNLCSHSARWSTLSSNTIFSFTLLLREKLSPFENWDNWQKSCGGTVMLGSINGCCQPVPYFIISEWSCQSWQAASGRLLFSAFFPSLLVFMKVAKVSSHQHPQYILKLWSAGCNQSEKHPPLHAETESSRHSELFVWGTSMYQGNKSKNPTSYINNMQSNPSDKIKYSCYYRT